MPCGLWVSDYNKDIGNSGGNTFLNLTNLQNILYLFWGSSETNSYDIPLQNGIRFFDEAYKTVEDGTVVGNKDLTTNLQLV